MIYFSKDLSMDSSSQSLDFSQYRERFDFSDFIHIDKRIDVEKICNNDKWLLADIVAAVFAQLQKSEYLQSKRVAQKGLYCCQDVMTDRGYNLTLVERIYEKDVKKGNECRVLVAGCQSRRIQRSRVDALIKLIQDIPGKFRIFFSGKNPGRSKYRTANEAVEMERYFESRMKELDISYSDKISTTSIELDEIAHDTKTNVKVTVHSP